MCVGGGLGGEEAGGGDCFPLTSWIETEQLDLCTEIFTRQGRVMVGEPGRWVGRGQVFTMSPLVPFNGLLIYAYYLLQK